MTPFKVGLIDVDSHGGYPNLALMKVAGFCKDNNTSVEWYDPMYGGQYQSVYVAKTFTFTPDYQYPINSDCIFKGGTGYSISTKLPDVIEHAHPDYSIYPSVPKDTAYGFLTRGCIRNCPWCVVPKKEGSIHLENSVNWISEGGRRKRLILMDNNILAYSERDRLLCDIIMGDYVVDFNQGLDARLVDTHTAELLTKIHWINNTIRFGCDTKQQLVDCMDAITKINKAGFTGRFFLYCMLYGSLDECYYRLSFWRNADKNKYVPFAQPFRDVTKKVMDIPQ